MDKKVFVPPGRSSDSRFILRLYLPVPKTGTVVITQSSSPLTALAQRYGFAPYSLFTPALSRRQAPGRYGYTQHAKILE